MSKLYDPEGNPVCDCTVGAECEHHEGTHRPVSYILGGMRHLTCTRGDLAVSMAGAGDPGDVFDQKFAEHLAEIEEAPGD